MCSLEGSVEPSLELFGLCLAPPLTRKTGRHSQLGRLGHADEAVSNHRSHAAPLGDADRTLLGGTDVVSSRARILRRYGRVAADGRRNVDLGSLAPNKRCSSKRRAEAAGYANRDVGFLFSLRLMRCI
jgi:hypothetical protein